MTMDKVLILLPKTLTLLRSRRGMTNPVDPESYSMYFENFIYPLREEMDVVIDCAYGGNMGNCWKIDVFPEDTDSFPLSVKVYDEWGKLLAKADTQVRLVEKSIDSEEFTILCFGDSMTHRHFYVDRMAGKLNNLRTLGTRTFGGGVFHEGRGGWDLGTYLGLYEDGWGGPSPFLFPKNVAGRDYYGVKSFYDRLLTPITDPYSLDGYRWEPVKEGQSFFDGGKLWRYSADGNTLFDENPVFEFDFGKYLERHDLPAPDAFSLLMGANDVQNVPYEDGPAAVERFMDNLDTVVSSVRKCCPKTEIILHLPVTGAEQYAWGLRGNGSFKRYRLHTLLVSEAILGRYEGREHFRICPTRLFTDPEYGFAHAAESANVFSDVLIEHQNNWVHPNLAGYNQMGDVLASLVEDIRKQDGK